MTTTLDKVKQGVGVFYTDPRKDDELAQKIAGAKAFLISAGVPASVLVVDEENPSAIEAIIIYCKMAQNTDPAEMRLNPVLVAIIDQLRNVKTEITP